MNEFVFHFLSHSQYVNTSELRKVTQKVEERVQIGKVTFLKANSLLHNLTEGNLINHTAQIPLLSPPGPAVAFISQSGVVSQHTRQSHGLPRYTTAGSQCPLVAASLEKNSLLPFPAQSKRSPSLVVHLKQSRILWAPPGNKHFLCPRFLICRKQVSFSFLDLP